MLHTAFRALSEKRVQGVTFSSDSHHKMVACIALLRRATDIARVMPVAEGQQASREAMLLMIEVVALEVM